MSDGKQNPGWLRGFISGLIVFALGIVGNQLVNEFGWAVAWPTIIVALVAATWWFLLTRTRANRISVVGIPALLVLQIGVIATTGLNDTRPLWIIVGLPAGIWAIGLSLVYFVARPISPVFEQEDYATFLAGTAWMTIILSLFDILIATIIEAFDSHAATMVGAYGVVSLVMAGGLLVTGYGLAFTQDGPIPGIVGLAIGGTLVGGGAYVMSHRTGLLFAGATAIVFGMVAFGLGHWVISGSSVITGLGYWAIAVGDENLAITSPMLSKFALAVILLGLPSALICALWANWDDEKYPGATGPAAAESEPAG